MKRIHLRTARERKKLTQEQLAAQLGWRQARISALETTITHPEFDTVVAIADALEIDPRTLAFGAQERVSA